MATNGRLTVVYHSTPVVERTETEIVLDTGGWFTQTTKTRMNQASSQFGLRYQVYQKNFQWFVDYQGKTYTFEGNECRLPLN